MKAAIDGDTRYTHNTCFETFPFPQFPCAGEAFGRQPLANTKNDRPNASPLPIIDQIRTTAQELHEYRSQQMECKQWGITKLYNEYFHEPTSQLFKLHAKLDALVLQAYGFSPDDDLLEKLLTLNLELADREQRGEPVVGPWALTQ